MEHHIQALFDANGINYTKGAITERTSRPDFVLPSIEAYRDPAFPAEKLTVLAAKSTCKDRWRQILAEADRAPVKHLLTLEPGISPPQMDEMAARRVELVVPLSLQLAFEVAVRGRLQTVTSFIERARGDR